MNVLKRKRELRYLQKLPALTKSQVYDKLYPFATSFGLSFTEREILFPQPLSTSQKAILNTIYFDERYKESIPYADIVAAEDSPKGVRIRLRNGYVFYFMKESQVWYVRNPLKHGEPSRLTVGWWKFSGWITLGWWRLTGRNR